MLIKNKARNIKVLNEALGNIELTEAEKRSLNWLCGFESSTIKNIISVFQKAHYQDRTELEEQIEIDRPSEKDGKGLER